jgi:hypothetical protein
MLTYKEAVELAKRCALNARLALAREAAAELWKMAKEYQEEAAKLDSGRKPDIGELPPWLEESPR